MKNIEQGETLFFENNKYVAVYGKSNDCIRCDFDGKNGCPNSLLYGYNVDCQESKIVFKKVLTKLSE